MLETATWRTKNRKHFDLLESLYGRADRPLRMEDWDPGDDASYAAGLVHQVGSYLLASSIQAGGSKEGKASNRRTGKAWKSVEPSAGVRAAIFLTIGTAAVLSPEIEGKDFDQDAIKDTQKLVEEVFGIPNEDSENIAQVVSNVVETLNDEFTKEAVEREGLADTMAIQIGQAALSYQAMSLAGVNLDELVAFEPVRGVPPEHWNEIEGFDWLMTFSLQFGYRWKAAKESYLDMAYARSGIDVGGGIGFQLVVAAHDYLQRDDWQWADTPGIAVVKSADALSNFREEYNLVLDCLALGYWVRKSEREMIDLVNTFDDLFTDQLREKYEANDERDVILKIAMNEVRESLPVPFAQGADAWAEVLETALPLLQQRGEVILAQAPELDEDADIPDERREFTFGLGYGLGVAVEALGIDGTQPRQGED